MNEREENHTVNEKKKRNYSQENSSVYEGENKTKINKQN